jgi:hypothetical protein
MPAQGSSVEIKVLRGGAGRLHHAPSWDMGSDSSCAIAEEIKGKGDK